MGSLDYTFVFGPIQNHRERVKMLDHQQNRTRELEVSLDDRQLLTKTYANIHPVLADLIDIQ